MSLLGKALLVTPKYATVGKAETLTNKSIDFGSNTITGTLAQFNTALTNGTFATLEGISIQFGSPNYDSATGVFTIPKYITDLVNNVDPVYQLQKGDQTVSLAPNANLKIPSVITTNANNTSIFINTVSTQLNYSYNWEFSHFGGKLIIPGGASIAPMGASWQPSGISINVEGARNTYVKQSEDGWSALTLDTSSYLVGISTNFYGTTGYVGISVYTPTGGTRRDWQFRENGKLRFPDNTEQSTAWIPSVSLAGYATESYVNSAVSNLVSSAPATLDTLYELAAALGNDSSFATTTANALGSRLRVDINSQGLNVVQQQNARTNLGLATVAATGSYNDLSNKPYIENFTDAKARSALSWTAGTGNYDTYSGVLTLPTQTSHLTNDSGYITGSSPTITTPVITSPVLNDVITRKSTNTTNFRVVDEWVKVTQGSSTNTNSPILLDSFLISNYRTVKYLIEVTAVHSSGSIVTELVEVSISVLAGSGSYGVYLNAVTLVHAQDYFLGGNFNAVLDDNGEYVTLTATASGQNVGLTTFRMLATAFRRVA